MPKKQENLRLLFPGGWMIILLLGICSLFLNPIASSAQPTFDPNQDSWLSWIEGERKDPYIVSAPEALFRIRLFDVFERIPERHEVWIDADKDGQYTQAEKIPMEESTPEALLGSEERWYSVTLSFDLNGTIQQTPISDPNKISPTFETKFCFYFEIDSRQISGDPNNPDPADPNNGLMVLGKTHTDGDLIWDWKEGAELLPGAYGQDAYQNDRLVTLTTSGGRVTMAINDGLFRNVHIEDENDPNRPERESGGTISELDFPYGFISFRIESMSGSEVILKTLFPAKVSSYAKFCRYYSERWATPIEYSPFNDEDFWHYEVGSPDIERQSLILMLKDNDLRYDSDDTIRQIESPWGLGLPKNSGEGVCFITLLKDRVGSSR